MTEPPRTLSKRAANLWRDVHERLPEINAAEQVILEEVCRCVDLLDQLDVACRSDDFDLAMVAMTESRRTTKTMMGLIAALRLPDPRTGKRPGRRPPRGAYRPRSGA